MPVRYSVRRDVYERLGLHRAARKRGKTAVRLILFVFVAGGVAAGLYLRALSRDIAISDAKDAVALAVNSSRQKCEVMGVIVFPLHLSIFQYLRRLSEI